MASVAVVSRRRRARVRVGQARLRAVDANTRRLNTPEEELALLDRYADLLNAEAAACIEDQAELWVVDR